MGVYLEAGIEQLLNSVDRLVRRAVSVDVGKDVIIQVLNAQLHSGNA